MDVPPKISLRLLAAILCLVAIGTLASCGTVTEELLVPLTEYNMQQSVSKAKPGNTTSTKQQVKERERLINEGKCPTCQGVGKTPDGLYTCFECKGTGKYPSSPQQTK